MYSAQANYPCEVNIAEKRSPHSLDIALEVYLSQAFTP